MKTHIFLASLFGVCALPFFGFAQGLNSVDTRQKITSVIETLDQLQPRASDVIEVALTQLDSASVRLGPEQTQRQLQSIYRFGLVLQQAHGTLERISLHYDTAGEVDESLTRSILDIGLWLADIELRLLEGRSRMLTGLLNPDERIKIYKLIDSLNKSVVSAENQKSQ